MKIKNLNKYKAALFDVDGVIIDSMSYHYPDFYLTVAKAAKMFCVAVTTSLPKQYLKPANVICKKISEVTGILK